MNCDMKRSISLYSYQDEYYDGKLDLEGCLRETAKTGATGVELLAEQMIKKFPLPIETEEFREQWFGWLEKYHLTPSCYDAFLENRIFDNRTLCLGEQINMMKRDIRLASLLGFIICGHLFQHRWKLLREVLHMHSRWMSELVLRYMPHFLLIPDGQTDIWK